MYRPFTSTHFTGVRWVILSISIFLGLTSPIAAPGASPVTLREYDVKAACLFNIAKFSDWPEGAFTHPSAPIIVGILGQDPFGAVLDRIVKGRVVNNRAVLIRRATHYSEMLDAHVVFVCASQKGNASLIASALSASNVLVVGDTEETAPFAAINFSVTDGRTLFVVNLDRAGRAAVRISSKLLALAASVSGRKENAMR